MTLICVSDTELETGADYFIAQLRRPDRHGLAYLAGLHGIALEMNRRRALGAPTRHRQDSQ